MSPLPRCPSRSPARADEPDGLGRQRPTGTARGRARHGTARHGRCRVATGVAARWRASLGRLVALAGGASAEAAPGPGLTLGRAGWPTRLRPPGAACYQKEWHLPAVALLDPASESAEAGLHDHERNVRIIEEKLRSFQIPATVVATNTGPVVTQYEVRPDARVKLSRIEGLADDLAMALAARSIRIEAPIPGRDVVGIEIPNHASEMVGFRSRLRGRGHGRTPPAR